jgi:hypothetical protein
MRARERSLGPAGESRETLGAMSRFGLWVACGMLGAAVVGVTAPACEPYCGHEDVALNDQANTTLYVYIANPDWAGGKVTTSGDCDPELQCEESPDTGLCTQYVGVMTGSAGSTCTVSLKTPDGQTLQKTGKLEVGCAGNAQATNVTFR